MPVLADATPTMPASSDGPILRRALSLIGDESPIAPFAIAPAPTAIHAPAPSNASGVDSPTAGFPIAGLSFDLLADWNVLVADFDAVHASFSYDTPRPGDPGAAPASTAAGSSAAAGSSSSTPRPIQVVPPTGTEPAAGFPGILPPAIPSDSAAPTTSPRSAGAGAQVAPRVDAGSAAGFPKGGAEGGGGFGTFASMSFTNFPVYTLDYNNGVVLFPGFHQRANPAGSVDLRAQVRDAAVTSLSWDTTNLAEAGSITGTNTYRLRFRWNNSLSAGVSSVTLTVTRSGGATESQTYSFARPAGFSWTNGPNTTWPAILPPQLAGPDLARFASHYADVEAATGALNTAIELPSYSPLFAGLAFDYDSLAADPRPLVLVHHTLDDAQAIPSQTRASLTFNGSTGATSYYDTSQFIAGDVQRIAMQADASSLSSGRYSAAVDVVDVRTTNTTTTYSTSVNLINHSSSPFGAGWSLRGWNQVLATTGGAILDVGRGESLWFESDGVGGYNAQPGEFSSLVKNGDDTWTRALPDGYVQNFRTDGKQANIIDRNGLRITYTYESGGKLETITDPYNKVTTLAYDSNAKLQTATDPSNRVTTFTQSSGKLTGVTLPDGQDWAYAYDSSGKLETITDPLTRVVTVVYDGAARVGTITRPDGTHQTFVGDQTRGRQTSGTSSSPGPALLLAEARASATDPLGRETDLRHDWRGMARVNQVADALGNVATSDRDANGLATTVIDRLNRISRFEYNADGMVTKAVDPAGNTDQFTYNGFNQVTQHTNARNKTTNFTYDSEGNLTEVEDAAGSRATLTYTANGQVATVRDARDHVTSFAYDGQDRVATITYPDAATRSFSYNDQGGIASTTDERGYATTYSYDPMNRLTGVTDALGNRTTYTLDAVGEVAAVLAPLSRTTTLTRDSMNRVSAVVDPLGRTTTLTYDDAGNPRAVIDPLGRRVTFVYDELDRRTVVIDPLNNRTTTTFDAEGQVVAVIDPLNRTVGMSYTKSGWLETVTTPLGFTTTYTYSATGKVTRISDPANGGAVRTSITYDNLDRQQVVEQTGVGRTTLSYDAVGNSTGAVNPMGFNTTYVYDARNRLTTLTTPSGQSTVRGYDAAGNLATFQDELGSVTTIHYDALNRATTLTDARSGVTTLAFDAANRRTGLTDPVGNRTTWAYDAADQLTTMTDPRGLTVTYAYDAAGRTTERTDREGRRVAFDHDDADRLTVERWLDGSGGTIRAVTTTYDAVGQATSIKDPDSLLTYTYDDDGRTTSAATSSPAGQPLVTLTYGYNEIRERTSLVDSLSSVGRITYVYDVAHRLTTLTQSFGGTAGPHVARSFDSGGRITSINRTIGGSGTNVHTALTYTNRDQVATITHDVAGSGTSLGTLAYAYDNANRLVTETIDGSATTYTYDATNQLTSARGARTEDYAWDLNGNPNGTGWTTASNNRLTASPTATYTYDNEGNLASKTDTGTGKTTTFSYDHRNRLTGMTIKAGGGSVEFQATYTYDALDRRIGVKVDADGAGSGSAVQVWHVYDGANVYADFDGSGALTTRYLCGLGVDELLARTDAGGTSAWYLVDRLGSVRKIADAAGNVVYATGYSSFGVKQGESGTGGDRWGFTGREHDAGTEQRYHRARYFGEDELRWTKLDPIGFDAGDTNLHRYVGNHGNIGLDPFGLSEPVDYSKYYGDIYRERQKKIERIKYLHSIISELIQETGPTQPITLPGSTKCEEFFDGRQVIPPSIHSYPNFELWETRSVWWLYHDNIIALTQPPLFNYKTWIEGPKDSTGAGQRLLVDPSYSSSIDSMKILLSPKFFDLGFELQIKTLMHEYFHYYSLWFYDKSGNDDLAEHWASVMTGRFRLTEKYQMLINNN